METSVVAGIGLTGAFTGTALAETVLVATAVVLGALLLIVRSVRARSSRTRKAAGSAYFDSDAAHYGPRGKTSASPGAVPTGHIGPSPRPRSHAAQPIAPSFTADRPATTLRPGAPVQPPVAPPAPLAPTAPPATTEEVPPPSMAEPPVAEQMAPPRLAPLPALRPKGTLPADLPAMPAPPPSDSAAAAAGDARDDTSD